MKIKAMSHNKTQKSSHTPRRAPNARLVALILPRRTATASSSPKRS